MHIAHFDALFVQVFGQILGHTLGQGRDQCAHSIFRNDADFINQIIDLHFNGSNFNLWVQQPCGANDLFCKYAPRLFHFPRSRRGRDIDRLRPHCVPFFEFQGAVIHTRWQAEPMFSQCKFPTIVAAIHAADLWNTDVAFISKNNRMIGNKFKQSGGRFAGRAPRQIARIVFDTVTHACRF